MQIEKTQKYCIDGQVFNQSYRHSGNHGFDFVIENPNDYAVDVFFSAQAGAGEITYGWHQPTQGNRYYNNGANGNSVQVILNGVLLYHLSGGGGSLSPGLAQERSWRGSKKGWSGWSGMYAHTKQVAQSGESIAAALTLNAKGTLIFRYGAGSGSRHSYGSHSFSVIY